MYGYGLQYGAKTTSFASNEKTGELGGTMRIYDYQTNGIILTSRLIDILTWPEDFGFGSQTPTLRELVKSFRKSLHEEFSTQNYYEDIRKNFQMKLGLPICRA